MSVLKVVLDTNCLLRSISRRSSFAIIIDKLQENAYELYLTNDILFEYEEKIAEIFSIETAELIIGAFTMLQNVKKIDIHFHLHLIKTDLDDNKFVDCAFAGNVNFIVSDDKHFNILKSVSFPVFNVITLNEFNAILQI